MAKPAKNKVEAQSADSAPSTLLPFTTRCLVRVGGEGYGAESEVLLNRAEFDELHAAGAIEGAWVGPTSESGVDPSKDPTVDGGEPKQ